MKKSRGALLCFMVLAVVSLYTTVAWAANSYPFITKWGSEGPGSGQFEFPQGITLDGSGNVYVVDTGNSYIQKFDSNGGYLTQWGDIGSEDGQFDNPFGRYRRTRRCATRSPRLRGRGLWRGRRSGRASLLPRCRR